MDFTSNRTRRIVLIALMAAIALLLAKIRFPIFPAAPFLKMDLGEIPLLLAACAVPMWGGVAALAVKELLSFLIFGTNIFGLAADFLCCGPFILVFSLVLRRGFAGRRFAAALLAGMAARVAAAVPVNLVILQLQYGSSVAAIWTQMPYILPFNALKCVLDGVCAGFVFRRLPGRQCPWTQRRGLSPDRPETKQM